MNRTATRDKRIAFGGMTLIVASVLSKALGAIYRIPLTNILGAEGIGLYQMVFPVYALMLTLTSSGIPTAVSRLVAEKTTLSDAGGVRGIVRTSAVLLLILGVTFTLLTVLISLPLARLQNNASLTMAYVAIAPAILIVAGSSVLKGYFQGMLRLSPIAVTSLVEQVVKMGVGLLLASLLLGRGLIYAVTGAILGVTMAELVSFVVLLVMYIRSPIAKTHIHVDNFTDNAGDIMRVSLPIAMGGIIFPILEVIDSVLIVNILTYIGIEESRATALYGLLLGPVGTLIHMPIVVTLSLAILVVPVISKGRIRRHADEVRRKAEMAIKLSYLICVPAFFGMFVMADDIMRVLYPSLGEANLLLGAGLLRVSSVGVVLLAEVEIYSSLLEAMDKTKVSVIVLIISAVIKVIISIFLIAKLSIVGASIASILTYLLVVTADSLYMRHYLGRSPRLFNAIAKIMVSGLVMAGVVFVSTYFIPNIYASLFVGIGVGVAIYVLFMVLLNVMERDELLSLPFGEILVYLGKRIRFWERNNDRDNRTGNS